MRSFTADARADLAVAAFLLGVAGAFAGCYPSRALPPDIGARTPCSSTRDCPSGFVCPTGLQGTATCLSLTDSVCGNGVSDDGEACDDGNLVAGDGCRPDCTRELCGDAIVDVGEACDGTDGCSERCTLVVCGDSITDTGEDCDDGNARGGDGCSASCTIEACGNNVIDVGEACDDGNATGGDGCSADCKKAERCGDGIVDTAEDCDDANDQANDHCNSCRITLWTAAVLAGQSVDLNTRIAPIAVATDVEGNAFLLEPGGVVLRFDGVSLREIFDRANFSADGRADLDLVVDTRRRLIFVRSFGDLADARIERFDPNTGVLEVVAGATGGTTAEGADARATLVGVGRHSVTVDGIGNITYADPFARVVRRIDVDGRVFTVAGTRAAPTLPPGRGVDSFFFAGPFSGGLPNFRGIVPTSRALTANFEGSLLLAGQNPNANPAGVLGLVAGTFIATAIAGLGAAGLTAGALAPALAQDP